MQRLWHRSVDHRQGTCMCLNAFSVWPLRQGLVEQRQWLAMQDLTWAAMVGQLEEMMILQDLTLALALRLRCLLTSLVR